ncbi:CAP domain-containing protein [uncultured Jannaschia sp.]|uniref:CAP domain-containing protein n=1 Tax=uncultured Jannaschia sp. TaxID=293347 RepID=UPI0026036EF1|nr:CAP domain-containing protein [uncultured Jannaschia sp.]
MNRRTALVLLGSTALAACSTPPPAPAIGPDGRPLPPVYRISGADKRRIPFRALDAVNALRAGADVAPLTLDSTLSAAAETHSRDMSLQNRPWHFGSDGSSPIDRAQRVGFDGRLLGEAISETYETELETVAAWLEEPGPRRVLLDPEARRMGFAFFQEPNGKIWYTLNVGT